MKALKTLLFVSSIVLFMGACKQKQEPTEPETDLVTITKQQFLTDKMQFSKLEMHPFESTIVCNGAIVSVPNGVAKVNAIIPGTIKQIYCQNGQLVEKNQVILEITGSEVIEIQKDFGETAAQFKRLENDFVRMKSLFVEKVISEKEYIIAESEYKASKAKYQGLKMKIEMLGFSVNKIENGDFYTSYQIKAPIRGHVSNLTATIGNYIDPQSELIEIVDPSMFQVKLFVFANDIEKVKLGQKVRFKSAHSATFYYATINGIGVSINNESKAIECYATISDKAITNLVANVFIEAEVILKTDSILSISSGAIIKHEDDHFVLVLENQEKEEYSFQKIKVKIGRQYQGFTEILDPKIDAQIVSHGVYNITF